MNLKEIKEINIAHKEVLSDLERFLGYDVERTSLVAMNLRENNEWGKHSCWGIGIDEALYNFDDGNDYYKSPEFGFAKKVLRCSSIKDLFKCVLTHEYFHNIFQNKYKHDTKQIITENILNLDSISNDPITEQITREVSSINEAFAFWGEDKVGSYKNLFEETVQKMKHVNRKTIKFFYQLFHKISDESTNGFVIKNLTKIVKENIRNIKDVKLKSVAEALDDRLWLSPGLLGNRSPIPYQRIIFGGLVAKRGDDISSSEYNYSLRENKSHYVIRQPLFNMVATVYDPNNRY